MPMSETGRNTVCGTIKTHKTQDRAHFGRHQCRVCTDDVCFVRS